MKNLSVMADPVWKGKHPYHDHRFIIEGSGEAETSCDGERYGWRFVNESDRIIAEMRDCEDQAEKARLFAAAPDLLEACKLLLERLRYYTGDIEACDLPEGDEKADTMAGRAIFKAERGEL